MVNCVINEAVRNKSNIDIEILDFKQCFDSMWLEETNYEFYETGLKNNNLNIIYNLTENNKVAGITERVDTGNAGSSGQN